MEKISTTFADVVAAVTAVVSEDPERVYSAPEHQLHGKVGTCFYVHTNTDAMRTPRSAGCVVGAALHRLGVPLETLQRYEGSPASLVMVDTIDLGSMHDEMNAGEFLGRVQREQDGGTPWGEALAIGLANIAPFLTPVPA